MFFGRGAGELPTASAVVGDIFDIVRNMEAGCCGRIGCTCYKQLPVKKMEDTYNLSLIHICRGTICICFLWIRTGGYTGLCN